MLKKALQSRTLSKPLFYLLSFTWGLPVTLIGCIYGLIFLIIGRRPKRFGYCYYFELKRLKGGFNIGLFIFSCENPNEALLAHEHGHALQNCFYGLLMPFIVSMPSCIRYHYRNFIRKYMHKRPKKPYDSIWFENEATVIGNALYNAIYNTETTV